MANANSSWLADRIKNDVLGMSNLTVALYTNEVTSGGAGDEVSGGSYARKPVTLENDGTGRVRNQNEVEFPNMPTVVVKSAGIWDDNGNLIIYGKLDSNKSVQGGDPLKFVAHAIKMNWLA